MIEKTEGISYEIILVDNASSDGSKEFFSNDSRVTYIYNDENLGFGRANNIGIEIATGKYLLLLNSDTLLLNNAVKLFFNYFEKYGDAQSIGALGCVLKDPRGNPVHSGGLFPTYKALCSYQLNQLRVDYIRSIRRVLGFKRPIRKPKPLKTVNEYEMSYSDNYSVIGADLFLKNDRFAHFDERYFMYLEETDLQLKLHLSGKRCYLIDGPEIIHFEGGGKVKEHILHNVWYDFSSIIYAKKNLKKHPFVLKLLVFARFANPIVINRSRRFLPKIIAI
ncbi:MAG: glycosyltransferase [Bacteroidales bacterium]|nr:glycosyltransferase [Bacteroidales bacterium]